VSRACYAAVRYHLGSDSVTVVDVAATRGALVHVPCDGIMPIWEIVGGGTREPRPGDRLPTFVDGDVHGRSATSQRYVMAPKVGR
jgi:hypothetical protein